MPSCSNRQSQKTRSSRRSCGWRRPDAAPTPRPPSAAKQALVAAAPSAKAPHFRAALQRARRRGDQAPRTLEAEAQPIEYSSDSTTRPPPPGCGRPSARHCVAPPAATLSAPQGTPTLHTAPPHDCQSSTPAIPDIKSEAKTDLILHQLKSPPQRGASKSRGLYVRPRWHCLSSYLSLVNCQ